MTRADLIALRLRLGLTQAEFGALIGQRSRSTISRWEDGTREIPEAAEVLIAVVERFPEVREWLAKRTFDITDGTARSWARIIGP